MNNETVNKIISLEWDMFDAVNKGKARAACQEDYGTFSAMRAAQFNAWSKAAAEAYLGDLIHASASGRNLVSEKYVHMMKTTEPIKYEALLQTIPFPADTVSGLACKISDIMLEQTRALFEAYPYVSGEGRPLYSIQDNLGIVSVETYQLSELLTYSEKTLTLLLEHITALSANGKALARIILENTVGYYGYSTLDSAEAATKERIDKIGIQMSFGCSSCE